jgi:hypothetical protein
MMAQHEPMIRAQLLLTPAQRQRLRALAQREGRSLSDVARRALEVGLDTLEGHTDEVVQERLKILAELSQIREAGRARYGVYQGDLVAESRQEREEEMERVWRGE